MMTVDVCAFRIALAFSVSCEPLEADHGCQLIILATINFNIINLQNFFALRFYRISKSFPYSSLPEGLSMTVTRV